MNTILCSKLVRQGHVLEDPSKQRTFNEVKSNLPEYDTGLAVYSTEPIFNEHSFLEVDEEEHYETPAYKNNYSASDSKVRYDDDDRKSRSRAPHKPSVRSAESFLNDGLPEYIQPDVANRYGSTVPVVVACPPNSGAVRRGPLMRRPSNDMIVSDDLVQMVGDNDEHRRKPEAMRSISEDVPARVFKAVTRRSLSHPEKDSQVGYESLIMCVLLTFSSLTAVA